MECWTLPHSSFALPFQFAFQSALAPSTVDSHMINHFCLILSHSLLNSALYFQLHH